MRHAARSYAGLEPWPARSVVVLGLSTLLAAVIVACEGSVPTTATSTSGGNTNGSSNGGSANGSSNGGAANGGASSAWPGNDAALADCTEYGIELSGDCSQCPEAPLGCPCFEGTPVFPAEACTFGHCITAIDCSRVCGNTGDPSDPQPGDLANPELNVDVSAIMDCVEVLKQCNSGDDSDCGDGKCVFDPASSTGQCGAGERFQICREADDCQSGFCIHFTLNPDVGHCDSGEPGSGCETSDQCLAGTCVLYTPGPADFAPEGPGFCTSGLPDEPCTADEQCTGSTHCVPEVPMRVVGSCSPGEDADLCDDDGDCQSGFCFVWGDLDPQQTGFCTTGGFREPCIDESDCESGYCSRQVENTTGGGSCVPGDALSPCFDDQDCASDHCALLIASEDPQVPFIGEGLCTTGASGDPCQDNAECASASCLDPDPIPSASCPSISEASGTPCENGGVCNGTGLCFPGKCE